MLHHIATISVCYGGHFESKMSTKIQKSSDLSEIWFPSRLWCCELISKLHRNVKHYELMCRLLSEFSKWPPLPWKPQKNTKNLKCSELDDTFHKFFLTCVHIILRLRNFSFQKDLRLSSSQKWFPFIPI